MRSLSKLVPALLLIAAVAGIAAGAAVSSIDLGSEWEKVAVVNLKPGQPPITVAINEMSKRKSPALVGFHAGGRLLGEDAAGIVARYPEKVFAQVREMVGRPVGYVRELVEALYLPYDVVEDGRGGAGVRIDDGATVYTAEELAAMVLGYGLRLAEFHSKVPVKDAVVTVPPYFGQAERRGLLQAALLARVNVLALINEHSGAAMQYGIGKDFSNESRYVVFYDMGSSSTYAALVYFSAYPTKESGKTVMVNQFQVKDVRWNSRLGGQDMELCLVEYFADEFNKQVGNGVDVRKSPKAMAKLKKQVKRTKEILSANTAAPVSVESIYDDRDFRSSITREKFEELCADLWVQALVPIKEVLHHASLKVDELYAVELIGGATRVPKLQARLQDFLGRKDLDKHLDADEAIVLGAALHAANLSDGIKLNRKLGMIDGSTYGIVVEFEGPDFIKDEHSSQLLVPRMKKVPTKMFRSIQHDKDFEVFLNYESPTDLPPGVSSVNFAKYGVSGLGDASAKYSSRNLSSPVKANLHFSQSRSGVVSLDRAEAVIEITEWVEVPVKNLTAENSTTSTPNVTLEAGPENTTNTGEETINKDSGLNGAANSTVEKPNNEGIVMEKKLKKRTFRVPLKIVDKTEGPGSPLSKESFLDAIKRLEDLDKKDKERRRTAELKNDLEAYIYSTKEKLEASEDIQSVSTEQERRSFMEKLDEVQDWLYMDGEDASASEFEQRLDSLKAIGDPIFFRFSELTARPAASEATRRFLDELKEIVSDWEKKKPWLPKSRVDEVVADADKLKLWLDVKESLQKTISPSKTPAFTSEETYSKLLDIQDEVARVNRIPKPKPKVEKPPKGENATASNTTDSDSPQPEQSTTDPESSQSSDEDSVETTHDEL